MTGRRKNIIYSIAATLCFVILLAAGFGKNIWDRHKTGGEGQEVYSHNYEIVLMGDSIIGNVRGDTSISAVLEKKTGQKVYNGALGGTCMGRYGQKELTNNLRDVLSMVSLSKSIAGRDFSLQEMLEIKDNGTEYFPETIAGLKEIDFGRVEVLLLEHCVNDYHIGEVIENPEDSYDENTYAGAVRSTVELLKRVYPKLRIILVTAPYTWYTLIDLTCEEYVRNGYVLEDYVNAQLALAEELDIEVIDIYHDVFPHETWEDWMIYSVDGLHPNEAGRVLIAEIIADYLEQNPEKSEN